MATYRDVTWVDDDTLEVEKINQMASNDRFLFDNMVQGYRALSPTAGRKINLKIACGVAIVAKQADYWAIGSVYFGNYFSPSCSPVVVISHSGTGHCWEGIGGLGTGNTIVDHRGFRYGLQHFSATPTTTHFSVTNYVHWIAIGW